MKRFCLYLVVCSALVLVDVILKSDLGGNTYQRNRHVRRTHYPVDRLADYQLRRL